MDHPTPTFLLVDTDDLRAAGNDTLRDADLVTVARHHVLMASSSQYGTGDLHGAATRFEDRYSYLLEQLATEVEEAGLSLRGTAEAYEHMDLSVSDRFTAHAGLA